MRHIIIFHIPIMFSVAVTVVYCASTLIAIIGIKTEKRNNLNNFKVFNAFRLKIKFIKHIFFYAF